MCVERVEQSGAERERESNDRGQTNEERTKGGSKEEQWTDKRERERGFFGEAMLSFGAI